MDNVLNAVVPPATFPNPQHGPRAHLMSQMWGAGMPCNDTRFVDVIVAAKKAGCSNAQAWSIGCLTFYASKGYVENLGHASKAVRHNTLLRKAAEGPTRSLWRWLADKFKGQYVYLTDEEIYKQHNHHFDEWSAWSDKITEEETAASATEFSKTGAA